ACHVHWISESHQLNNAIKCIQYPFPIILDILKKRSGYKFFTKLDTSIQYYTLELDEESQDLCTSIMPFGKYKCAHLPMCILQRLEPPLQLLTKIVCCLHDNSFTINPLKFKWVIKEADWLVYWLILRVLKTWKMKIDAILHMNSSWKATELHIFIGCSHYYHGPVMLTYSNP
ncbi:hypothetical protein ACHAW6_001501, partial [Cyclotella cf. meneghiniana]